MNIIEMNVDELIPYENNPRKNELAIDKVAESIKEFGFKVPIVVDANNVIVTGHTRLKAAKKLGITTVPVIKADDLTDEQIKAFRLVDNKTAEFAEWDFNKLQAELDELSDIDMSIFGFEDKRKPSKDELEENEGELLDNIEKPVVIKIICEDAQKLRKYEEEIREIVEKMEGVKVSVGGYDDTIE